MTLLCYDDVFLQHDTGSHPESAERLRAVWDHLVQLELDKQCAGHRWLPATMTQLTRIHDLSYVDVVQQSAEQGGGRIEADTVMSVLSHQVALQASGAVCAAVEEVMGGRQDNALCLVRPPGHHARARNAMGFCLFNHIAVGARHATDAMGANRVLIIDWDVHHGNGTQESFYACGNVGFLSIHRYPFYPGSGDADDTGTGDGLGATCNVPIEFGTTREVYLERFSAALQVMAEKIRPDLVMISAGFDAHRSDPIGSLGLEVDDYGQLTRWVREVADQFCDGRIVSVLEGGYNPMVLPLCIESHLRALLA